MPPDPPREVPPSAVALTVRHPRGGPGFDPRCGHPLPTGWVGVSIMWPSETEVNGLPALSREWQHVKLSDVSLGTRPQYNLVVYEDAKKPTNQTNKPWQYNFYIV